MISSLSFFSLKILLCLRSTTFTLNIGLRMPPGSHTGKHTAKKLAIKAKMPASPIKKVSSTEGNPRYDPRITKENTLAYAFHVLFSLFKADENSLHGSVILVRVGSQPVQDWAIHRSLICTQSDMFNRMFANECIESRTGVVLLKEDDPAAFEVYAQWLYTGKILIGARNRAGEEYQGWDHLVNAYILGDKLQDGHFADAVMDTIIAESNTNVNGFHFYPIGRIVQTIYNNTREGSPLRRLIVDQHVFHGAKTWFTESVADDINKEFLLDLVKAMFEERPKPHVEAPDQGVDTCAYHGHITEPCYKVKHQKDQRSDIKVTGVKA